MTVEERIIKFLRHNRGTYTPKEIASALDINYDSVKRTLLRMYRKRIVFKSFRNNYHLLMFCVLKQTFE